MLDVFVLPETNSSPYIAPENRGPLDPANSGLGSTVLRGPLLVSWRVYSLPRWRTTCFVSFMARCYAIFLRSEFQPVFFFELWNSIARWWFQICFIFIPTWERFPFWRSYFSKGLKPPTRLLLLIFFWKLEVMYVLELTERVLMKSLKMMILKRASVLNYCRRSGLCAIFGGGNQRWNWLRISPLYWGRWNLWHLPPTRFLRACV